MIHIYKVYFNLVFMQLLIIHMVMDHLKRFKLRLTSDEQKLTEACLALPLLLSAASR